MNTTEYIAGMQAAKAGKPCPANSHPDFVRGYGVQYEHEQVMDAMTSRGAA
jgi:hypothetical protein